MGTQDSPELPPSDVFTSNTYRQDLLNAVAYAVIGAVLVGGGSYYLAFLDTGRGRRGAVEFFSTFPAVTPDLALTFAFFLGYLFLFLAALSGLLMLYSGVVRPLQRATGGLDSSGGGDTDGSRAAISVEMVDGTQTFQPDAECVDCEETAIGVVSWAFEDSTPGEVVPVCPMHLHERRDELEAQSRRVEVETFV